MHWLSYEQAFAFFSGEGSRLIQQLWLSADHQRAHRPLRAV
ncbi:hypothetical protein SynMEDNS5_01589 [Synechococcus sp. MEDNS5]|nr:hypothetical protein SynMEDNS5_01589 [Synechococcus sp. MEDNS5]